MKQARITSFGDGALNSFQVRYQHGKNLVLRPRRIAAALAAAAVLVLASRAAAGPQGEQVVRGSASVTRDGSLTTIRAGNNSIINYSSFDVGRNETVRFIQPTDTSRVLNRINSATPSRIDGSLFANGIVYFANPAGVIFGPTSTVDVGGLFAAAGNISNGDFLGGINHFTNVQGSVLNYGNIQAGAAALIGRYVENYGSITGSQGAVMLLAGQDVYIGESGASLMVRLKGAAQEPDKPGVTNAGSITAAGPVSLGAGDLYSLAVRNEGSIKSKDITVGTAAGAVEVSGILDASNASGAGGNVMILGEKVGLFGTYIDVSGSTGGGNIRIGGDKPGQGTLPQASTTYIDSASKLNADATQSGNGGTIAIWSKDSTTFDGSITARGGMLGGDGGSVKVSSGGSLDFEGVANLSAPAGHRGGLLLDPTDVLVDAAYASGIEATLNTGSDVTVSTAIGGTDAGNITIAAPITKTAGTDATLTFTADNNIIINGSCDITSTAGALNVVLNAIGNVTLGSQISSNHGNVGITSAGFTSDPLGQITSGGGGVSINNGVGTANVGGLIDAGGGNIDITAATINISAVSMATTGGHIALGGNVIVANDLFIQNDNGGAVSVSGTITADAAANNRQLSISSGPTNPGNITLAGDIGGGAGENVELGSLILIGGHISTANVRTLGMQQYDGPTILNGNLTSTGNLASTTPRTINFTGPITLANNVVITTAGGAGNNVTFAGAIDADLATNLRSLQITAGAGAVNIGSTIGATQGLGSLSIAASDVMLSGDVTAGPVAMNATNGLSLLAQISSNGSDVTIHSPNFSSDPLGIIASSGGHVVIDSSTGKADIGGLIDAGGGGVDITASTINISATNIKTTTANITLQGNVVVANDVFITNDNGGSVSVSGTINADAAANNRELSISSGPTNAGTIALAGDIGGGVGDNAELGSLILIGGRISTPNVRHAGHAAIRWPDDTERQPHQYKRRGDQLYGPCHAGA